MVPWTRRAEGNLVIGSGTSKRTRQVVVRVAIRCRTRRLKHRRIHGWTAPVRRPVLAAAAILCPPERVAGAPAPLPLPHPKLRRAPHVQVRHAPSGPTHPRTPAPCHHHWQVVPVIDKRD